MSHILIKKNINRMDGLTMNVMNSSLQKNDAIVYHFPEYIDFETASNYFDKIIRVNFEKKLVFDLTTTREVHSSFIGFLLDIKQKYESNGGHFSLKLSPSLEHLFDQIKLLEHFNQNVH